MSQDEAAPGLSSADEMRADVSAAMSQLKADAPEPVSAPTPTTPLAGAEREAEVAPPATERPRDPSGRFAPKVEAAETPSPASVTDADPTKANDVAPSKAVAAPAGWSAEAKAEFEKLSPVVQAAVLKRESDINDGGARWSEEKRTYETALAPVRELSTRHNVAPAEAIKRLAAANDYLERDAPNAIRWLAQSYKVDLSALAANPAPTPSQPQADPVVAQLQSKVSQFEEFIQNQQLAGVGKIIEDFAAKQSHWDEQVMSEVNDMIPVARQRNPGADQATILQSAYDMAIWANPNLRTSLIAAQTASADTARKTREATDKARRGAISVNGAPSGGSAAVRPPSDPNASVQDDVRAAFAQLRH